MRDHLRPYSRCVKRRNAPLDFLPLLAIAAHAQVYQGKTLVTASLVSDTAGIVPGKPFEVGVLLEMAPGWHTYLGVPWRRRASDLDYLDAS